MFLNGAAISWRSKLQNLHHAADLRVEFNAATYCPPRPTITTLATSSTALATFCPPRLPFRRHTSPQRNTLLYMSDSSLSPARTQVVEGGCEPHRGSSPHVDRMVPAPWPHCYDGSLT